MSDASRTRRDALGTVSRSLKDRAFRGYSHTVSSPGEEMGGVPDLDLGRTSYTDEAWQRALDSFASADRNEPLAAEDLEMLARSAYMLGRDDDYVGGLERAYNAFIDRSDVPSA